LMNSLELEVENIYQNMQSKKDNCFINISILRKEQG